MGQDRNKCSKEPLKHDDEGAARERAEERRHRNRDWHKSNRPNQACQWRTNAVQFFLQFRKHVLGNVAKTCGNMEAVPHLGERRFSNVQKMQTLSPVSPDKSFNDVRGDRIRSSSQLAAQLEPLKGRKCFDRQMMQLDEQIICTLPRDERVVS